MFSIGNLSINISRDSSEIPASLIKDLEKSHLHLRDPIVSYEADIEFHDAIRQLAFKAISPAEKNSGSEEEPKSSGEASPTKTASFPSSTSPVSKVHQTIRNFFQRRS